MTMIITAEQARVAFNNVLDQLNETGWAEITETYSRNCRVTLTAENEDLGVVVFHVTNGQGRMATLFDLDVAVIVFNHYASQVLLPSET